MPAPSGRAAAPVFYTPDDYRPDDSAVYLMRRILALVGGEVDGALEPQGLTSAQWVPLLKLHTGQASTVAELARWKAEGLTLPVWWRDDDGQRQRRRRKSLQQARRRPRRHCDGWRLPLLYCVHW